MAENNKDKKPFSFVGVATEGMDMKEEQKRMLERKGKTISSFNIQEQEKDIVQRETQTSISHTENLTPSLVKEEEPIEDTRSNEGGKTEQTKKVKTKGLICDKKRNYVQARVYLTEQEQNILRLYLSSSNSNLSSFLTDLVLTKIKSIKKELTKQGIKALLGIEDKEIE